MNKIKVGIIGGAGYTGGELIRILLNHPGVRISFIQSESNAGNQIGKVHHDLLYAHELKFTDEIPAGADVVFLCKGHGESEKLLESGRIDRNVRIVDLSQDFRIEGSRPDLQEKYGSFLYGLPELNKFRMKDHKNVANPGCFATSIELALLPLVKNGVPEEAIHVSAVTGSTGAGQKLSGTSHFTWRDNNMTVYKPFRHQHLREIRQSLTEVRSDFGSEIWFIPYRGNFTRGIISTVYTKSDLKEPEIIGFFESFYRDEPFVMLSSENVHIKQVVNTNFCLLYAEKIEDRLMIISVIDNLVKGASGQAVQNMNLMFGLEETAGLYLKGSAF